MSYYCKGEICPRAKNCLRAKAYEIFPKNSTAAGVWLVPENTCIKNNYEDGVFKTDLKNKAMEEKELKTALTHWLICNKDFEVFKKGERYWLELLSNGDLCGRSDNIKGVVINYFPYDQFYDIFYLSSERV